MANWKRGVKEILEFLPVAQKKFPDMEVSKISFLVTAYWIRTEFYSWIGGGHLARTDKWLRARQEEERNLITEVFEKVRGKYGVGPGSLVRAAELIAGLNPFEYQVRTQQKKLEKYKFGVASHFRKFCKKFKNQYY